MQPAREPDTRTRLLQAALLLFRQRGYHGVGIRDILVQAQAPKGSLYHHFPGGKDQMAVEVLEQVAGRIVAMIERDPSATTAAAMHGVGLRLRKWMLETSTPSSATNAAAKAAEGAGAAGEGGNACALIASFAAEGDTAAAVAAAARQAYERIAAAIAGRLEAEGAPPRQARDTAFLVIATLEGGGLVSQTLGEPRLFTAAIERAAALCQLPAAVSSPAVRKVPP